MSKHNSKATAALVLGIISMIAWLIPLAGFPVSIVGIIMGCFGVKSEKKTIATVGLILSIIGLVICLINSVLGAIIACSAVM